MVSRVVVTGGAGMLGGSLVRHLAADGTDVLSVDIRSLPDTGRAGLMARHAVADIRDTSAISALLRGADAVVHCAGALPSYPASEIRSVIVDGTRSALAASQAAGVTRFVHISSTAVYGLPTVVPTPEGYPLIPVDAYGRAKVAAERVCAEYRADGMCVPILRPKTFLGPGRLGLFDMLFEWAEDGRNFPVLGAGDSRIQMLDIDDLLRAVVTVLRSPAATAGATFNVGAAEFHSLRDEFQAVLDAAGHGKRVVSLPTRPALAVLVGLERTHLSPVYGRLLRKLLADSYVSIAKARDQLGFEPRYSNRDAILRTYQWWRSHRASRLAKLSGRTSSDPWRQGILRGVKALF